MAKYSDHSTIGGQVLAHRIRMIKQNANIIFIAGKIGFVLCFFVYFFINYSLYDLWNYFCILKAGLSKKQKRTVYTCIGIDMDGKKEVLSLHIGGSESAKYWLSVLHNIMNCR